MDETPKPVVAHEVTEDDWPKIVELAQIEGGGEGVLPALWLLAGRYASRRGLQQVEWIVHAVYCAEPNLKLRRVLQRRGFVVREVPGHGEAFHCVQQLTE